VANDTYKWDHFPYQEGEEWLAKREAEKEKLRNDFQMQRMVKLKKSRLNSTDNLERLSSNDS